MARLERVCDVRGFVPFTGHLLEQEQQMGLTPRLDCCVGGSIFVCVCCSGFCCCCCWFCFFFFVLFLFFCQLNTSQGHLRRENLNWENVSIRLACRAFSWLMIDVEEPSSLWVVPFLGTWSWGYKRASKWCFSVASVLVSSFRFLTTELNSAEFLPCLLWMMASDDLTVSCKPNKPFVSHVGQCFIVAVESACSGLQWWHFYWPPSFWHL